VNEVPKETLPEEFYRLMEDLQTIDFVLVELTLYLDTHPEDLEALKQFNTFSRRSRDLRQTIEARYGPLLQFGHSYSEYPWAWADPPWPWQM
jgi:spore coat protein JB